MAHKKGGGSSRNGRDANPQMLGVERYDGEMVNTGTIILRQRGTKIHPGRGVGLAKDDTLFATIDGRIVFERLGGRKSVSVYAEGDE